ncbi:hypothetical protein H8356DRAFT_1328741 [Neocallimastix lanati (nom. inval.)]|nr:hypothetical protein H8356DRAFT_1328741 [Neocallimastix sp. JGI-2020a]
MIVLITFIVVKNISLITSLLNKEYKIKPKEFQNVNSNDDFMDENIPQPPCYGNFLPNKFNNNQILYNHTRINSNDSTSPLSTHNHNQSKKRKRKKKRFTTSFKTK